MKRNGQINRAIGPCGVQIDFDKGHFQLGLTGRIEAQMTFEQIRERCIETLDELLYDIKPQLDSVPNAKDSVPFSDDHLKQHANYMEQQFRQQQYQK